MGIFYNFICPDCGYRAQVNGGVDRHDAMTFKTMVCADCLQLVDALVEIQRLWFQRRGNQGGGNKTQKRCVVFCPKCNGINVIPWEEYHPCPKCGARMTREEVRLCME